MNLHIGLIDKNIIMRLGVAQLIRNHFEVSFEEANHVNGLKESHSGKTFSAVIVCAHSREDENANTIRHIRKEFGQVPLIIYDDRDHETNWEDYFRSGIDGYLLTRTLPDELPSCLQRVMAGRKFVASDLLQNLLFLLRVQAEHVSSNRSLTNREEQIARLLCEGMGTSSIANSLGRKPSTISTIKQNIMKKMNVKSVMELSRVFEQKINVFQPQVNGQFRSYK